MQDRAQEDQVRIMAGYIGTPTPRLDGHAKVTGAAKYAAEVNAIGLVHGSLVTSTITRGRIVAIDASEYHVPVNADVQDIKVIFVDEPDATINPLGIKGLGEIGIVGVAAAIANAVYHATGKRVRDLPITLDQLQP
jgi:CO/xanthine dehydrogenase Mo-binding subunit